MGSRLGYPYLGKLPSMGLGLIELGCGFQGLGLRVQGLGCTDLKGTFRRAVLGWEPLEDPTCSPHATKTQYRKLHAPRSKQQA